MKTLQKEVGKVFCKKSNSFRNIIMISAVVLLLFHLPFSSLSAYGTARGADPAEAFDYSRLGLNRVSLSDLSQYVKIVPLAEGAFYSLNFDMKIAGVALTTNGQLLVRTTENQYHTIPLSEKYIHALELTAVLEPGTSLKLAVPSPQDTSSLGFFVLTSLFITLILYLFWLFYTQKKHKSIEKGALAESKKTGEKGAVAVLENKITFNEVQGIDELKPDLLRLVDSLKNPAKYKKLGARPTKGLILYGPPGTGKTLIARAISGEAGVPFFSVSGSDFIEKYVGVGASRIRDLFSKARKSAPCIIFIDEVDAIGGNRGDVNNSERDQTINALLTELDGFAASEGILTICATNRLDILDAALTRPGRFDLKIAVSLPDKRARFQILKLHSANKKLSPEIDIDNLSKSTNGFSGAELENLLNEAALIAATRDKAWVTSEDVDDAFFKIIMNGHKKKRSEEDTYTRLVAYHEAGHTLATRLLTKDTVSTVTIVQSTSGAGGVTFRSPAETSLRSKKDLKCLIKVMYAGRAAEEILLDSDEDITTGASQDIRQATEIIRSYIGIYGMGAKGMIDLSLLTNQFNIIEEAATIANELYMETLVFLKKNKDKLDALALALLEKETLYEAEIDALVRDPDYFSSTKAL